MFRSEHKMKGPSSAYEKRDLGENDEEKSDKKIGRACESGPERARMQWEEMSDEEQGFDAQEFFCQEFCRYVDLRRRRQVEKRIFLKIYW